MPHVIVKLHPGRSHELKLSLANELTAAVQAVLGSKRQSISVAIEEVDPTAWEESVHKPDILAKPTAIYRQPGEE
ncbi:4-oxalocrotonate tautomerase family protein [Tardiphaga sp.]|jgi:4-oxalocrotonate tautomerase|uniref:4-oxalocrotonate tautomerase family protein n=1 Tax=Tardiphaga sp. TaxID=1926292 RepID=UPI0037D9D0B8